MHFLLCCWCSLVLSCPTLLSLPNVTLLARPSPSVAEGVTAPPAQLALLFPKPPMLPTRLLIR
jgi:hypothetical protein